MKCKDLGSIFQNDTWLVSTELFVFEIYILKKSNTSIGCHSLCFCTEAVFKTLKQHNETMKIVSSTSLNDVHIFFKGKKITKNILLSLLWDENESDGLKQSIQIVHMYISCLSTSIKVSISLM